MEHESQPTKKQSRSPSYPGVGIEAAIERARVVYAQENKHAANSDTLLSHWGYSPRSGPGLVVIAALKRFGLLETSERGMFRLSSLALDIILDTREPSPERAGKIREAALRPIVHKELWEKWEGCLPSDSSIHFELTRTRGFTDRGAADFIAQLRSTMEYVQSVQAPEPVTTQSPISLNRASLEEVSLEIAPKIKKGVLPPPVPESDAMNLANADAGAVLRDQPLNLLCGDAVLRYPYPMSEEDYEWLMQQLKRLRPKLVAPQDASSGPEQDPG